jgi:hypothetical protein
VGARCLGTADRPRRECAIKSIVDAIALSATAQLEDSGGVALKQAYVDLKKLLESRVPGHDLDRLLQNPRSKAARAVVEEELGGSNAADDPILFEAARKIHDILSNIVSANSADTHMRPQTDTETAVQIVKIASPTRGALRLDVSTSTTILSSGSDFSIFINISNPFDIPITIYQVLTHIPVKLIDRNTARLVQTAKERERAARRIGEVRRLYEQLKDRLFPPSPSGVAIAVGNEFNPDARPSVTIGSIEGSDVSIGNIHLEFPQTPTPEQLDAIFGRIEAEKRGVIPVTLQPGDTVVRQFVLRTRNWLFFSPLNYTFNIRVTYSADGVDHSATVAHQVNLRSGMAAISVGAIAGAVMGSTVRNLMTLQHGHAEGSMLYGGLVSVIASIAVVVAFARKANAQSFVSIEDFWGGALIGFSVGFFGFERFATLFEPSSPSLQNS